MTAAAEADHPRARASVQVRRRRSGARPGEYGRLDESRTGGGPAHRLRPSHVGGPRGRGYCSPRLGADFRAVAASRPMDAQRALHDATRLRWVLRQIFTAVAHEQSVARLPAVGELNASSRASARAASESSRHRAGSSVTAGMQWSWRDATANLESVMWPVVRSAAELLVSDEAGRIRECGGPECGWMYVDRSRNGLRRWCEMESCGTREKSRRRANRRTAER